MSTGSEAGAPPPIQAMLVVDIVDSTATRVRIGDGAMEHLRRRTDLILERAVTRHGGAVAAWLGDGCEAVFPSATSAIHAARDMLDWVERDNERMGRVERIRLRAAVDVGPSSSLGTATHRLAGEAEPGTVAISDRASMSAGTWSDLRDPARGFGPLATRAAKPFADLIPLPGDLQLSSDALIGRNRERTVLLDQVASVQSGQGRVAAISGPPGIGKSSLLAATMTELVARGFVVLTARCTELPGRPYGPIGELIDQWVEHVPEHALRLGADAAVLALVSEALLGPEGEQSLSLGNADADRARLNRAIAGWVEELGASTPAALVIEDVQWAGSATREAIQAVVRAARQTRVLVVTTVRTSGGDVEKWHEVDVDLGLEPLPDEAAAELVSRINPTLNAEAIAGLAARAHGNPLFAVELARHGTGAGRSEIPRSLQQTIAERVEQLDGRTVEVLAGAAVLGERFQMRALREMLDLGDDLYDALDEAVDASTLVGPDEHLAYRFAHQMVRTVLYEGIGRARRARLHEKAGLALEALGDAVPSAELAEHFAAAAPLGHADRAAEYCRRAAVEALETFAMAEAADWYRRGLELVEQDDHLRARLQVGWAGAARHIGTDGWSEPLEEACAVADRLGDGELLAEAALAGYRGTFTQALAVDEVKVARLERALELIPDDQVGLLSRVHAELGLELEWSPDAELARLHSDRALELAERTGDELTLAMVLAHRLWTLYHPTALREEATARLLDLTATERRPMLALEAHGAASFTAIRRGDARATEHHLSNVIRIANDIGVPLVRWFVLLRMWPWVLARGRYLEAEQMAEEMYRLGRLTDHPDADQAYQTHLFWLGFDRRDRAQTRDVMAAVVPFARKVKPIVWPSWAHVCADAGMLDQARELYGLIEESPFDIERADQLLLMRLYDLAVLAEALGDAELGRRLIPLIESRVEAHATMTFATYGSMARAMGLACAAAGDTKRACTFLTQAVESNRRAGIRAWEARSLIDLARFDSRERESHLSEATSIADSWGLPAILDRVTEVGSVG